MRSLEYARAKARETREAVGASSENLLERLHAYLTDVCGVDIAAMSSDQLRNSRAEIDSGAGVLEYDKSLPRDEVLMLLAHELGHLVLHARLRDRGLKSNPLAASVYGAAGSSGVSRYSPRTYEETQADSFALEFLAPSDMVWTMWLGDEGTSSASIARAFGCGVDVIRIQLAHALHAYALGDEIPSASRKSVELTQAQRAAAEFTGAPAIVDAGPGTGKTATVIERIRFLCEQRHAQQSEILVLTFSNEAAQELSERIASVFGKDVADQISVRTFHGFGVELLHWHGHHAGLTEEFELLDEDRQIELVNGLLGTVPCDRIINLLDPLETATRVVEHINYCKQRLIDADALEDAVARWTPSSKERASHAGAQQLVGLYRAYEAAKKPAGGRAECTGRAQGRAEYIDFADLIALSIRILESESAVRAGYATQFPWVIVDEFQDVTRATSRLVRAFCGQANPPWVVGDARQSIYQFLGAAPENVTAFMSDFKNARRFELDVNYRSSASIVTAANQLATLLETADGGADAFLARWTSGAEAAPHGRVPVTIAEASTDAAEADGVASWVRELIADGVAPGYIAVLCRRHVDVRNVILELSRRGIKAQASGVLTAEGAAGDLTVMLALADAPAAAMLRAPFAFGRRRHSTEELNDIVAELLEDIRSGRTEGPATASTRQGRDVVAEIYRLQEMLNRERDGADGFAALAVALFDHGVYLREIVAMPESAERQMALVEIVSAVSLAAAYRATHADVMPRAARVGFAERLRARLTRTLPVPWAPRLRTDAVHVMTCHASKGLEFPHVVVMGQTLPDVREKFSWLPESLRPERSRDESQSESLLFVGVTRAKWSVLVSFPMHATSGPRSRLKAVVPVLDRWRSAFGVPVVEWRNEAAPHPKIRAGNLWNVPLPKEVKASALHESVCPQMTYLETYAGARFPSAMRELYPQFFDVVRRSLRAVVAQAAQGVAASDDDARAMFAVAWPVEKDADHQHGALYRATAERMVVGFARAFRPMAAQGVRELEPEIVLPHSDGLDVRLDLIARYRQSDGTVVALAFRPGTLGDSADRAAARLNWSDLPESKRGAFALLEHARQGSRPYVYLGRDERIYEYSWSRIKTSLPTLVAALEATRAEFSRGEFNGEVSLHDCDRCRVRVCCPQWVVQR